MHVISKTLHQKRKKIKYFYFSSKLVDLHDNFHIVEP